MQLMPRAYARQSAVPNCCADSYAAIQELFYLISFQEKDLAAVISVSAMLNCIERELDGICYGRRLAVSGLGWLGAVTAAAPWRHLPVSSSAD